MPITIWAARMIGADFPCQLVEYMRTTVYQIPSLKVKEPRPAACIIFDEPGIQSLDGHRPLRLPERRRHIGPI